MVAHNALEPRDTRGCCADAIGRRVTKIVGYILKPPHFFCAHASPVCAKHMLLSAFKIRALLLALLLVGAASLETALRACVALRARERATPKFTPLNFSRPAPPR